jgi:heptosyltransferase-2
LSEARSPSDLVVRAPNHLGDVVMALPALAAAGGDVLVVRWLAPLLEMAKDSTGPARHGRVIAFDRGRAGMLRAARELRAGRYERGLLLAPSFSSAFLFALGGVKRRRGTPTDGRSLLLTDRVRWADPAPAHRAARYLELVTGAPPAEPPAPHLAVPLPERERWSRLIGAEGGDLVGIFPGSNASSRRWDADRYAELAARVAGRGARVVVFGSTGERDLTAHVAGSHALDLGGRTDLPLLAAGLAACRVLVTNDSGPMHLAAAVGTRTVSVQGPADPRVTRPLGEGHVLVWGAPIPCVPCVKNECPRSGAGFRLPEAERECLRLIGVDEVEHIVLRQLTGVTT